MAGTSTRRPSLAGRLPGPVVQQPRAPIAPRHRQLIADVIARRQAWHELSAGDSMETWPAYDRSAWIGRLRDVLVVAEEAADGVSAVDPREALLDVMAVASAWIDQMGERPSERTVGGR